MVNLKKYIKLGLFVLLLTPVSAFAAQNSGFVTLDSIESRDSGSHGLRFSGVPNEGCTLSDRAIIVESGSVGAKSMLSAALTALATGQKVQIRVDGCTLISPPDTTYSAPKVIKVFIVKP